MVVVFSRVIGAVLIPPTLRTPPWHVRGRNLQTAAALFGSPFEPARYVGYVGYVGNVG